MQRRRGGITTGEMLQAIGDAVAHPGVEVPYLDHAMKRPHQARYLQSMAKNLIERLGLKVVVKISGSILYFRSDHEPVYVSDDGHIYKRIG